MAKIKSWSGNSPHAREVVALEKMRRELPNSWFGYANIFVKDPRKDAGQEVDLILVCDGFHGEDVVAPLIGSAAL